MFTKITIEKNEDGRWELNKSFKNVTTYSSTDTYEEALIYLLLDEVSNSFDTDIDRLQNQDQDHIVDIIRNALKMAKKEIKYLMSNFYKKNNGIES
jgi:hypothetical protein